MELDVESRVVLLSLLPKEGDVTTIRVIHELKQALSFTEQEHEELGFKQEGERVAWAKDIVRDIPIGPRAHVIIADTLKALSDDEQLTEDYLALWDKFEVEDKPALAAVEVS